MPLSLLDVLIVIGTMFVLLIPFFILPDRIFMALLTLPFFISDENFLDIVEF